MHTSMHTYSLNMHACICIHILGRRARPPFASRAYPPTRRVSSRARARTHMHTPQRRRANPPPHTHTPCADEAQACTHAPPITRPSATRTRTRARARTHGAGGPWGDVRASRIPGPRLGLSESFRGRREVAIDSDRRLPNSRGTKERSRTVVVLKLPP